MTEDRGYWKDGVLIDDRDDEVIAADLNEQVAKLKVWANDRCFATPPWWDKERDWTRSIKCPSCQEELPLRIKLDFWGVVAWLGKNKRQIGWSGPPKRMGGYRKAS